MSFITRVISENRLRRQISIFFIIQNKSESKTGCNFVLLTQKSEMKKNYEIMKLKKIVFVFVLPLTTSLAG